MNSIIFVISVCLLPVVLGKSVGIYETGTDGLDDATFKRQLETTCAFYRWSHCPNGKKEVANNIEGTNREDALRELMEMDFNEEANHQARNAPDVQIGKDDKMRWAQFRKLFKFLQRRKQRN